MVMEMETVTTMAMVMAMGVEVETRGGDGDGVMVLKALIKDSMMVVDDSPFIRVFFFSVAKDSMDARLLLVCFADNWDPVSLHAVSVLQEIRQSGNLAFARIFLIDSQNDASSTFKNLA